MLFVLRSCAYTHSRHSRYIPVRCRGRSFCMDQCTLYVLCTTWHTVSIPSLPPHPHSALVSLWPRHCVFVCHTAVCTRHVKILEKGAGCWFLIKTRNRWPFSRMQTFWVVFLVVIRFCLRLCWMWECEESCVCIRIIIGTRYIPVWRNRFSRVFTELIQSPSLRVRFLHECVRVCVCVRACGGGFCAIPASSPHGSALRTNEWIEKTVTEKCLCQQIGRLWRQRAAVTAAHLYDTMAMT